MRAATVPGTDAMLITATSLADVDATLRRLLAIMLLVTAAVLAALAVLGLWVVRVGLRPLDEIGTTAAAIADGDLTRRVERAEPRTEVGRLGLALNAMLAQIEAAFDAQAASERRCDGSSRTRRTSCGRRSLRCGRTPSSLGAAPIAGPTTWSAR